MTTDRDRSDKGDRTTTGTTFGRKGRFGRSTSEFQPKFSNGYDILDAGLNDAIRALTVIHAVDTMLFTIIRRHLELRATTDPHRAIDLMTRYWRDRVAPTQLHRAADAATTPRAKIEVLASALRPVTLALGSLARWRR